LYWFELLIEAEIVCSNDVANFMAEGNEILSIVVSSIRTAKANR